MYKTFKELNTAYGPREQLSTEEERKYVNDCFDTYEYIGFTDTFGTIYTEEEKHKGKKFTVLGRVKEATKEEPSGADLECLPMWNIRFEDGTEMAAYPEEICIEEIPKRDPKYPEKIRREEMLEKQNTSYILAITCNFDSGYVVKKYNSKEEALRALEDELEEEIKTVTEDYGDEASVLKWREDDITLVYEGEYTTETGKTSALDETHPMSRTYEQEDCMYYRIFEIED